MVRPQKIFEIENKGGSSHKYSKTMRVLFLIKVYEHFFTLHLGDIDGTNREVKETIMVRRDSLLAQTFLKQLQPRL